jgi:hypothetical protein
MKEFVRDNRERTLLKGDVIRVTIENKSHPDYGKHAYAIVDGGGFGCNPNSRGNAIFVWSETTDINEAQQIISMTRAERIAYGESIRGSRTSRWERFWKLEILIEA